MLIQLFRGGLTVDQALMMLLACTIVVFLSLPIHEFAHAFIAHKLGDDTAKWLGRMTVNPIKHIDPIGSVMILLAGFGWAKPVPVDMRNFRSPKRDMAFTALAGPISNLLMAFLFVLIECAVVFFFGYTETVFTISLLFANIAIINISLAVFNFLPIPPLDGSRILNAVLPNKIYYKIMQYEQYIQIALFALLFFGFLSGPLSTLTMWVYTGMFQIGSAIF